MESITVTEVEKALSLFRALNPHDQDVLLDLAEGLLQSQEEYDDSRVIEP